MHYSLEEPGGGDEPALGSGGEIVEFDGAHLVGDAPVVAAGYLEMLDEFGAGTDLDVDRAAGGLDDGDTVGGQIEREDGSGEGEGGHDAFEAVEARILKPQIERNLEGVKPNILIAHEVGGPAPDGSLAEIDLCAVELIAQAEVDAEADARNHHFAEESGRGADAPAGGNEVLLPEEGRTVDANLRSAAEFSRGRESDEEQEQGKDAFHLSFRRATRL